MSLIDALGYFVLRSDRIQSWSRYGTGLLGMQVAAQDDRMLRLRMDDRAFRWIVSADEPSTAIGWEVRDYETLSKLGTRLEADRVEVESLRPAELVARGVQSAIRFQDPAGNRHEAFCGHELAGVPFTPGRPISGFRTGALGMGHVVLHIDDLDLLRPFYEQTLGFALTDFALTPFKARFYHVNARHHSLAMIESGRRGIHHLMLEMTMLDDVGQAYDLALMPPGHIGTTLGRHTNDFMTSFYALTPDDFMVELGWGGRIIDPASWQAHEMTYGPSLWGHERTWLPPDQFLLAQEVRLKAAADGLRVPVQVMEGNYGTGVEPAPWWER